MPFVRELLDATPATRISEIHAERLGRSGIVQRSRMRQELEEWLRDPARLEGLAEERLELLMRLAFAGPSGLSDPEGPIEELAGDLLAFRSSEGGSWHGLDDWGGTLRRRWLDALPDRTPPPADRIPSDRAFVEGIAALTARIDLGSGRLTRTGEINRRDRPRLREAFFHVEDFGEAAQDEALDLALEFLSHRELLVSREGRLECHPELLALLARPAELARDAGQWWIRRAFGSRSGFWDDLSRLHLAGADAARAWGWHSDAKSGSLRWPDLPPLLRGAIAIGQLEARAEGTQLSSTSPIFPSLPDPDRQATTTADLLVYLSPMASALLRRRLEAIGTRESAGLVARYRLSREAVLEAAAHPRLGEEIPDLLDVLDPPASVRRVVEEWLQARRTCQFESVRLLRVRDPHRHAELAALPAVGSLVRETIPEWGFVVDAAREADLRRVLQGLGYDPPEPPAPDLPSQPWVPPVSERLEAQPPVEWLLDRPPEELRRSSLSSHSKYGEGLKELPFQDLLRVVEYAVLTDAEVEVILRGGTQKPARLRVLRIHKRKEPVSLEVRTAGGREDREIPLDSVRKIRLCD
jgi:hypothetical protein